MGEREELARRNWWRARRLRYNVGLVVTGLCAFALYAGIVLAAPTGDPQAPLSEMPEVTGFTTLFQGVCYLLAMAVANVLYGLGPFVERVLEPRDVAKYRSYAFSAGFWFSVALPFTIPLAVGLKDVSAW